MHIHGQRVRLDELHGSSDTLDRSSADWPCSGCSNGLIVMTVDGAVPLTMKSQISKRHVKLGVQLARQNPRFVPRFGARTANSLYHRRFYTSDFNESGIFVFEEDWDNLLLLDACRYDMFARRNPFDERVQKRISRGSDTFEFLTSNLLNRDVSDTVYVSGSPILYWYRDTIEQNFHDVIFVWQDFGWDDENKTVLPETMAEYALKAAERYPNKRLFVHFIQPHIPFIGSDTRIDKQQFHDPTDEDPSFWRLVETGAVDLTVDEIWELYDANLERALPHTARLVEELDGKTAVTSDHGNMLGERSRPIPMPEWGHPPGTYTEELVTVPWIEFESDSRRKITAGQTATERPNISEDVVEDRLRELGYV
jgi:hypothetical protein